MPRQGKNGFIRALRHKQRQKVITAICLAHAYTYYGRGSSPVFIGTVLAMCAMPRYIRGNRKLIKLASWMREIERRAGGS